MAVKKSAKKSAKGRPFTADDPRRGRGPQKGAPNAGRPPEEFKELCRSLATRQETIEAVEKILADPTHGAFIGALKWASEHGYGKPTQPLEHGVTAGLADAIRAARERAANR